MNKTFLDAEIEKTMIENAKLTSQVNKLLLFNVFINICYFFEFRYFFS